MRAFANLYVALDETNSTNEKVAALVRYFTTADSADAAWVVYFLSGRKPRQIVPSRRLATWAMDAADVPEWLFVECYSAVGDMAETITLLLPEPATSDDVPLHTWVEERLLPLRSTDEAAQRDAVRAAWAALITRERFVYNKLITGSFRVGVNARLVTRALAQVGGLDDATVAHRLMGTWEPTPGFYANLLAEHTSDADISRPYPFCLAYPLDPPDNNPAPLLGDVADWLAEWKWDGIRAQLVRRDGQAFLWTRGEELVTDRYPEVAQAVAHLPDGVVLDGELLPYRDGAVLPFAALQRRIGRKTLGKALLAEVPVIFLAYDLLEWDATDRRDAPLHLRRATLEPLIHQAGQAALHLSEVVVAPTWAALADQRASSRDRQVEGLMLKRRDSVYRVGRQRGDWWKWKVSPFSVDAVMIYAQRGSGRRASLYSDYTFAVWDANGQLVPFAKAYSGLSDDEMRRVDAWVRRHAVEKFGPVRAVKPELVMELGFEGIQRSTRHKSGIAVRFPRILRWRQDKRPQDADTLDTVRALLPPEA